MPTSVATFVFLAMAFAAGVAIAVQQVVNAGFRNAVGSAWWAGLASYVGGTLFMLAALLITRERVPSLSLFKTVPAASWFGGVLGGVYVALSLYLLPRLGVALVLALVIVGQMTTSLVVDHLGLFGVQQHAISPLRLLGALALVGGVAMIKVG